MKISFFPHVDGGTKTVEKPKIKAHHKRCASVIREKKIAK
jgi:hypothetical protein